MAVPGFHLTLSEVEVLDSIVRSWTCPAPILSFIIGYLLIIYYDWLNLMNVLKKIGIVRSWQVPSVAVSQVPSIKHFLDCVPTWPGGHWTVTVESASVFGKYG